MPQVLSTLEPTLQTRTRLIRSWYALLLSPNVSCFELSVAQISSTCSFQISPSLAFPAHPPPSYIIFIQILMADLSCFPSLDFGCDVYNVGEVGLTYSLIASIEDQILSCFFMYCLEAGRHDSVYMIYRYTCADDFFPPSLFVWSRICNDDCFRNLW